MSSCIAASRGESWCIAASCCSASAMRGSSCARSGSGGGTGCADSQTRSERVSGSCASRCESAVVPVRGSPTTNTGAGTGRVEGFGMPREPILDAQALHEVREDPAAPDHLPQVRERGAREIAEQHVEAFAEDRIAEVAEPRARACLLEQLVRGERGHQRSPSRRRRSRWRRSCSCCGARPGTRSRSRSPRADPRGRGPTDGRSPLR